MTVTDEPPLAEGVITPVGLCGIRGELACIGLLECFALVFVELLTVVEVGDTLALRTEDSTLLLDLGILNFDLSGFLVFTNLSPFLGCWEKTASGEASCFCLLLFLVTITLLFLRLLCPTWLLCSLSV